MIRKLIAKKPLFVGTTILLVSIGIIMAYSQKWGWTGFNEHIGPNVSQYQPGKTLWDWLQLIFIPVVIAIGGVWLNQIQKERGERAIEQRAESERQIAFDNQCEATLQTYIDKLSELLLEKKLHNSVKNDELRTIARLRTLTALSRLDENRKNSVVQFLYESSLIDKDKCIIYLKGADLSGAKLSGADLKAVDLSGADLTLADLSGANLHRADLKATDLKATDLRGVNLREANLSGADLKVANLSGAYLSNADLSEADLTLADLKGVYLDSADLTLADLSGANLSGADLRGADLTLAYLSGADLRGADLSHADLRGANLKDTFITIEQLEKQARSLQNTIMPDGTTHP